MSGLKRLFTSSKYLLTGIVCVGIIVMNVMGRIEGPAALEAIMLVVGLALGATAVEDAAKKIRGNIGDPKAIGEALGPILSLVSQIVGGLARSRQSVPMPQVCRYEVGPDDSVDELVEEAEKLIAVGLLTPTALERIKSEWKPGTVVALPSELCAYYANKRTN
jgi:hypothetical protein